MAIRRIRARFTEGKTSIKAIIKHPMETGNRIDKTTKKKIPAHFIEVLTISLNGTEVLNANLGPAVSRNPLFHIILNSGKKGDKIDISWTDNKGQKDTGSAVVG